MVGVGWAGGEALDDAAAEARVRGHPPGGIVTVVIGTNGANVCASSVERAT